MDDDFSSTNEKIDLVAEYYDKLMAKQKRDLKALECISEQNDV